MALKPFAGEIDPSPAAALKPFSGALDGEVIVPSMKRVGGQMIEAAGRSLQDVGGPRPISAMAAKLRETGAGIVEANPAQVNTPGDFLEHPITAVKESVAEMVPQVGAYAAGAALGGKVAGPIGALVGGLTPLAIQSYGGNRLRQDEAGVDNIPAAATGAVAQAALERMGAERLVGSLLTKGAKGVASTRLGNIGRRALEGAIVEGPVTEVPQQAIERAQAGLPLDTPEAGAEYLVAGGKGALGGGAISGAAGAIETLQDPAAEVPAAATPAPVATPAPPETFPVEPPAEPMAPAPVAAMVPPEARINTSERLYESRVAAKDAAIRPLEGELLPRETGMAPLAPPMGPITRALARGAIESQPQGRPLAERGRQMIDAAVGEDAALLPGAAPPALPAPTDQAASGPAEGIDVPAALADVERKESPLREMIRRRAEAKALAASIDTAAHEAATSPLNDLPQPTEGQKKAGNYAKGKVRLHGLDISIENPAGSERSGTDRGGKPWSVTMPAHYGYVKRTTGADDEQVDVYIGDAPESDRVFVVDQQDADTGKWDEHKAMLGFADRAAAEATYLAGFSDGRGRDRMGAVTEMSVEEFKSWLQGDTTKPAAGAAQAPSLPVPAALVQADDTPAGAASRYPSAEQYGNYVRGRYGVKQWNTWRKDGSLDRWWREAHGEAAGEAPTPAAPTVEPAAEQAATPAPAAKGKRITPLDDVRLQDETVRAALPGLAAQAGWADIGGRIIRDERTGEVTGRTVWAPKAEWWPDVTHLSKDGKAEQDAVRKAIAGEPLTAKEKRFVADLLGVAEALVRGEPAPEATPQPIQAVDETDPEAAREAELERLAIQAENDLVLAADEVELAAEQSSAMDDWLREVEADEREEASIGRDAQGADEARARDAGEAAPGDATARRDEGDAAPGDAPLLEGYDQAELDRRAAAKAADEKKAADEAAEAERKAQADKDRADFLLTGSSREADVAAARGQQDLLGANPPRKTPPATPETPPATPETPPATPDPVAAAVEQIAESVTKLLDAVTEKVSGAASAPGQATAAEAEQEVASDLGGARAKYPDGRLIPVAGDKVYQMVAGPFGTPASISGEVYQAKNGLRVRTTGSAAMIGSAQAGKTYALSPQWTVQGDPEVARRESEKARRAQEAKEADERRQAEYEQGMQGAVDRGYLLDRENTPVGAVVEDTEGKLYFVAVKDDRGDPYITEFENPQEGGRGMGLRGYRLRPDLQPPDGAVIRVADGDDGLQMRVDGRFVPVRWNDEAREYQPTDAEAEQDAETAAPAQEEGEAVNINAKHAIPLESITTPAGGMRASAYRSTAASAPWWHQGDLGQLRFDARAKVEGAQPASERVRNKADELDKAVASGWRPVNIRAGSFGTVWTLQKDGEVLTNAGAAALRSGVFDATAAEGDASNRGRDTFLRSRAAFGDFVRWLATLPQSTLESIPALQTKIGQTTIGERFDLRRGSGGEPRLEAKEMQFSLSAPQENRGGQMITRTDYQSLLVTVVEYAQLPETYEHWADAARAAEAKALPMVSDGLTVVDALRAHGLMPKEAASAPADAPASVIAAFDAFFERLRDGAATLDEYRAMYERVKAAKDEIVATLEAKTKADLLAMMGTGGQARYRNDKKAQVVDAVYGSMIDAFGIGRGLTYMMGGKNAQREARDKQVAGTTDADLKKYAEEVAQRREEMSRRIAGVRDPQTLADFDLAVRVKGESSLTPEQAARYDDLLAAAGRERRKAAQERAAVVQGADAGTSMTLIETTHTRDHYPLFVVKLADRVDRTVYDRLNQAAKRLGGWYSSYSKGGAVPGFQFKAREAADQFMAVGRGETVAATDRVEAKKETRRDRAVAKLREMADRMEAAGNEEMGRDRLTNTSKRAAQAGHAEERARREVAFARTMRNLADAIEAGDAPNLEGVTQRVQLELLDSMLAQAKYDRLRKEYPAYIDQERHKDRPATAEDAAEARWPTITAPADHLYGVVRELEKVNGTKRLRDRLTALAEKAKAGDRQEPVPWDDVQETLEKVHAKAVPWYWPEFDARRKRLLSMGIENLPTLRAALRELVRFRGDAPKANRAQALERALVGQKVGIDFFPTPKEVAADLVERAGVEPGMAVLEPSAGNGNIAEAIREAGAEPDVAEVSSQLREVLEAKGFNVAAHDFMAIEGAEKYDRIVMNPPFSNNMDIEHVRHAYGLLRPGGKLVAIMGEGAFFRQGKTETAFRAWLESVGGTHEPLPAGTFTDKTLLATTGANARIVEIEKGGVGLSARGPAGTEASRGLNSESDEDSADTAEPTDDAGGPGRAAGRLDRGRTTVGGGPAAPDWTGQTRARNRRGPVAVYRGAGRTLSVGDFDSRSFGRNTGSPTSGLGVFFAGRETNAGQYGFVERFALDFRNPYYATHDSLPEFDSVAHATAWRNNLIEQGYDSIILRDPAIGADPVFIAFQPTQVIRFPREPLFARSDARGGLTVDEARAEVRRLFGRKVAEADWLHVVPDHSGIPRGLYSGPEQAAVVDPNEGLTKGHIWLIASQLTADDAYWTGLEGIALHEGLHAGLEGMVGAKRYRLLTTWARRSSDPLVAEARAMVPNDTANEHVAEETLAYLVQNPAARDLPMIKRLWNWLRAWAFRLGIPTKMTPETLAALARMAIHARTRGAVSAPERFESDLVMRGQPLFATTAPQSERDTTARRFARFVDAFVAGQINETATQILGQTPRVMQALGAPALPLYIDGAVVKKALEGKHRRHFTAEILKQVPGAMYRPLMVFSSKEPGGAIVVTAVEDKYGDPVVAAIHFKKEEGRYVVNNIASIHSKQHAALSFATWIRDGRLRYKDDEALGQLRPTAPWSAQQVVQLAQGSRQKILGPADVFKAGEEIGLSSKGPEAERGKWAQGLEAAFESSSFAAAKARLEPWADELRYQAQDRFHFLNKAQKEAAAARGIDALPEAEDAYLAELRYHGMAGAAIEDFQRDHVDPLLKAMQESGLTVEDVDEYLHARHAKEANAHLKRINPEREDNEALSGMSNEEAAAVVERARASGKLAALEGIGKRVDDITRARRDLLVAAGLETQNTVDRWEAVYEHYVPLKREGFDDTLPRRGKGFDTRGKEKRRAGSTRAVAHILANVVAQHEATVVRAEKAKVGRALLEFARKNPDPALFEVDKVEYRPTFDAEGLVQYRPDPGFILADNVLVVRENGQDHRITFNEANPDAVKIATAMKNLGGGDAGAILNVLTKFTRFLSLVNTGANPEFIISNFARDAQTAGYNLSGTDADRLKWQIIRDAGKAWAGIRKFQKGQASPWAKHFDAFRKAGAQTGWMDHYKDIADRENALIAKVNDMGDGAWPKVKRGLKAIEEFIEQENTAVENAIRLSTFVHARQVGMTEAKAARLAKEITVNFNRRGNMGQALNAMYLFYNASIQGSVRILQALASSAKVRKLCYATIVFAAILDMWNRAMGDDDDDEETPNPYDSDRMQKVKERNLVLILPSGQALMVPLPWGYNVLHVMGQAVGETLTRPGATLTGSAARVVGSVADAFNPVGGSGSLLQMVSPTITDPMVQWYTNKDWKNDPLRPADNPYGVDKPDSQKYWNSVRPASKWITEQLNALTGGDEVRPGAVDISPESIDLAIDTLTGGAGRFVADTLGTPWKAIKGEDIETYEVPLLRKVYRAPGMGDVMQDYYKHRDAVALTAVQWKHYQGDDQKRAEIRNEHGQELRLVAQMKLAETRLRHLRKAKKATTDQARLREIDERIKATMERFNGLYYQSVTRAGGQRDAA